MVANRHVAIVLTLIIGMLAVPARAEEIWVTPTYQQDLGGLGILGLAKCTLARVQTD